MTRPTKLTSVRTPQAFGELQERLGTSLPFQPDLSGALSLAQPLRTRVGSIGNRFAILPMEGWDASADGQPTELVERRWRRFGESGAKLIWGGEAVAVRADGRANPAQLMLDAATAGSIERLRALLVQSHRDASGGVDGLVVGLQLTHSGRFARPDGSPAPRLACRHPVLDARVGVDSDDALLSDTELDELVGDFAKAAARAREAGFDFVDFKHCHGYLGHELLSARARPGPYGGDFAGRTRFLRRVVEAMRSEAPGLEIAVRLSAFDFDPYAAGAEGEGEAQPSGARPFGGAGGKLDLDETGELLSLFHELGIELVCTTAGSPYYNPHIQRPAFYPPSDGYRPPEDPLVGVDRQLRATAELKRRHPGLVFVGSAYSYLQEFLPNVAEAAVASGATDLVGIGRMALSYPTLPADVLAHEPLARRAICRTFSDCTTAPRNGFVSGCYPLDEFYKRRPEAAKVADLARRRG